MQLIVHISNFINKIKEIKTLNHLNYYKIKYKKKSREGKNMAQNAKEHDWQQKSSRV